MATLALTQEAFGSAEDVRQATGVLGLLLDLFRQFVHDCVAALLLPCVASAESWRHRSLLAWDRVPAHGAGRHGDPRPCGWRPRWAAGGLPGDRLACVSCGLWWFAVVHVDGRRARPVLVPTGVFIGIATFLYGATSFIWMPENVTSNENQFGVFGIALA